MWVHSRHRQESCDFHYSHSNTILLRCLPCHSCRNDAVPALNRQVKFLCLQSCSTESHSNCPTFLQRGSSGRRSGVLFLRKLRKPQLHTNSHRLPENFPVL